MLYQMLFNPRVVCEGEVKITRKQLTDRKRKVTMPCLLCSPTEEWFADGMDYLSAKELRRRSRRSRSHYNIRPRRNRNEFNARRYYKELARAQKLQNRRSKSKMLLRPSVTGKFNLKNPSMDQHVYFPLTWPLIDHLATILYKELSKANFTYKRVRGRFSSIKQPKCTLMRFMNLMIDITRCPLTLILTKTHIILSNIKSYENDKKACFI